MVTYLDFNATAPIEEEVLETMIQVYRNNFGNPNSRTHIYGNRAKELVNHSRQIIANSLNVEEMDVIFTSGSTESSNMAILGLIDYVKETGKNHFITTSIEHKAVLEPMMFLQEHGCNVDFVKPKEDGRVSADEIIEKVCEKTALVSVMHVNSETGIIQPVKEIGEFLEGTEVLFHIDATQSFGKMNRELKQIKYDLLSISAHKIRGPQGVGAFIKKSLKPASEKIKPLMYGGGQEYNMRPGTLPTALIAGFGKAVEICEQKAEVRRKRCEEIKKQFLASISQTKYKINGNPEFCIPNTINISFEDVDAEGIFTILKDVYAFSNGAACESTGRYKESYVLEAMGYDKRRSEEAIRLSWDYDTEVDFDKLVEYVKGQQEE